MKKLVPCILVILISVIACDKAEDYYTKIPGKAIITKIVDSQYNPNGKNQYADIFFKFQPDDKNASEKYRYKNWKDAAVRLSYQSRMNHFKPWIKKMKISEGNIYKAVRYEKKRGIGSAPPVVFKVMINQQLQE